MVGTWIVLDCRLTIYNQLHRSGYASNMYCVGISLRHASALVRDSIVWDDVCFEDGCQVDRCIVTDGVVVSAGAVYADAILRKGPDGQTIAVPFSPEQR